MEDRILHVNHFSVQTSVQLLKVQMDIIEHEKRNCEDNQSIVLYQFAYP